MRDDLLAAIESDVRQLVRERDIDPSPEGGASVAALIDEVIDTYGRVGAGSARPAMKDPEILKRTVLDRVVGLGDLQPLMDDPTVEEVWINGPGRVFCAREGKQELTNILIDEAAIPELVERMLRSSGRRLDLSNPFVDATLDDGSRLHVVIPNVTRRHWAVNIRKFVLRAHRLDELVRLGSLTESARAFLSASVAAGLNIVVSGGTQSGKTTMLNCLAAAIPSNERVITCEEVFELQVKSPDVVAMQTRRANLEGKGAIDLRDLIVEALRMRPDRIIVGEVRQGEALDLLVALNSGLPGMTSIHANSASEALTKLETLPLLAGGNVTHGFIVPTVASCIDLIVHLRNDRGHRSTAEIMGVTGRLEGERIERVPLFAIGPGGVLWSGQQPPHRERFAAAGYDLQELLG